MSFLDEFKQHKVVQVGTAYVVVAWVLLQFADLVTENLDSPGWVMRSLLAIAVIGLPVLLIPTWLYERTGGNLPRTGIYAGALLIGLVFAGAAWLGWQRSTIPAETAADGAIAASRVIDSIAVLPFESFSEDKSDEYFADGLTDTLLHKLAQLRTVTVIARNSSFQYKGTNVDVRDIGRELGASAIVEGSVQRSRERVRIIVQLVSTADGAHFWSNTYDDEFDNIFDLQDRITRDIVDELQITVSSLELERILRSGTSEPAAYDLLIRAREAGSVPSAGPFDPETNEALKLVGQALEIDPDYAEAWLLRSDLYQTAAFMGLDAERFDEFVQLANESARTALEKDPNFAPAYSMVGFTHWRREEVPAAQQYFRRALELDPNEVGALTGLGLTLISEDPEQARELFLRVRTLHPRAEMVQRQLHFVALRLGDIDAATGFLEEGVERHPDIALYYADLADLHADVRGRPDLAAAEIARLLQRRPGNGLGMSRMIKHWLHVGDLDRARAWLAAAEARFSRAEFVVRRQAALAVVEGDYARARSYLGEIDDVDSTDIALHAATCFAENDRQCLSEQADRLRARIEALHRNGRQAGDSGRHVLMLRNLELLGGQVDDPGVLRAALDRARSWPLLFRGGADVNSRRYLLAISEASLGNSVAAVAELAKTLDVPGGGIVVDDFVELPPDHSPFLAPLRETDGYREWFEAFAATRGALRQRMIDMERRGELMAPPILN